MSPTIVGKRLVPVEPHEELVKLLQSVAEIKALTGTTEDLHLDCKIWPPNDAQKVLAKALCGFANSDGGVISHRHGGQSWPEQG